MFISHRHESDERNPPEQIGEIALDQITSKNSNVDWTVGIIKIMGLERLQKPEWGRRCRKAVADDLNDTVLVIGCVEPICKHVQSCFTTR